MKKRAYEVFIPALDYRKDFLKDTIDQYFSGSNVRILGIEVLERELMTVGTAKEKGVISDKYTGILDHHPLYYLIICSSDPSDIAFLGKNLQKYDAFLKKVPKKRKRLLEINCN